MRIDKSSSKPLVAQVHETLVQQIQSGVLATGAKLPSIRRFAREHDVSTMTVVNAYQRLVSDGRIEARSASGYYVSSPTADASRNAVDKEPHVDSLWLLQRAYEESGHLLNAGCGWMPAEWMMQKELRQAMSRLARRPAVIADYGTPQGYLPLRQQIQSLLSAQSIQVAPRQVVITHGASHALMLVARAITQSGDVVLVDDPNSTNLFATLRALGLRLVGVDRTPTGPDLHHLQAMAEQHKPKAFFTTSRLHNPTGSHCSPATTYEILRLAEHLDFHVIDNDALGDLAPEGIPSFASLDSLRRVIHVGTFSKTLSPSLRTGFVACSDEMVERVVYQKMVSTLTTSELNEKLVYLVIVEGHYRTHLKRLKERLAAAQRSFGQRLRTAGLHPFLLPDGGPFIWVRYSDDIDTRILAERAATEEIMLAPGDLFRPDMRATSWLRLNVCFANEDKVLRFLRDQAPRRRKS